MWQYIVALCACVQVVTGILQAFQHVAAGGMLMAALTGAATLGPRLWRMTNRFLDVTHEPFGGD